MTRPIAMIFVLAGASFMSFVGVLMRLLDDATGFQILFYRSISLTLIVLAVICFRRHCTPKALLQSIDRHDLWVGGWLALAFAMATHHRLGGSSPANCLRRDMTEFLR